MLRIVLDTNVWLDWLLFDDPAVVPIRKAVADGKAEIVMDEATDAELERVLAYTFNNKSIAPDKQAALLEQCRRIALRDEGGGMRDEEKAVLPRCEDPDDQKFLELALESAAAYLVTRDSALLDLAEHKVRPLPYRIVTPAQLAKALRLVTR
jgi:putative PIN family toxin of toxin-antitoxin system